MKTSILRALRGEAQSWWAHVDLRRAGRVNEARSRERDSIRSSLRTIRAVLRCTDAYVSSGRGGTTIHGPNMTVRSHGSLRHFALARVLIAMGVPYLDTHPVTEPMKLIGLPLVAVGHDPDPAPWGCMSYAPLDVYLTRATALGATLVTVARDDVPHTPKPMPDRPPRAHKGDRR